MDFGIAFSREDAQRWVESARRRGLLSAAGQLVDRAVKKSAELIYPRAIHRGEWDTLAMIRLDSRDALLVIGPNEGGFEGERLAIGDQAGLLFCPLDRANAGRLRRVLPFTAPSPVGALDLTIGVGDRLGFASPGALRLFRDSPAVPVVAQQSVRELELTCRSYEEVLAAATWSVFQEGFTRPWGADGDHLKTTDWVRRALAAGCTMITADVSEQIRAEYRQAPEEAVAEAFGKLNPADRRRLEERYGSLALELDTGEVVRFTPSELARTALIYGEAVAHGDRLYRAGAEARGEGGFDFELSIDETAFPTTPQAHLFVALEAQRSGVKLSSLAPRFVGEFQKGIDYIGNPEEFRRAFRTHAAIARQLGYRISVHSGSDKFAVFPIIAEESRGRFHLKTSGTNWLEALRVAGRADPLLFRQVYRYALGAFPKARAYYQVTPDLQRLPDPGGLAEEAAAGLLEDADARRVLHVTYGEILAEPDLSRRLFEVLRRHLEEYRQAVEAHLGRHLERLGVPRRG